MFDRKKDTITLITSKEATYYRNSLEKLAFNLYLKIKDKSPKKGAKALVDSLLQGFRKSGVKVTINPKNKKQLTSYVYIPAVRSYKEIEVLYRLKKEGIVKKVIVGPLGIIHPDSRNNIVEHDCIDHVVVASEWMIKYISSLNEKVKQKTIAIPAGVNPSYFDIKNKAIDNRVLLYTKNTDKYEDTKKQEQETIKLLDQLNIDYKHIIYGKYKEDEYKDALSKCELVIFINQSETQGIAFAESWASGKPTIVYDKKTPVAIIGNGIKRDINYYKTCPYIHKKNGLLFKNSFELETILKSYKDNKKAFLQQFSPSKWVKENMSNKLYAEKIIDLFSL